MLHELPEKVGTFFGPLILLKYAPEVCDVKQISRCLGKDEGRAERAIGKIKKKGISGRVRTLAAGTYTFSALRNVDQYPDGFSEMGCGDFYPELS